MTIRPATAADAPLILPMVAGICSMHEALDGERYGMLPDVVERYGRWLPERAVDPRSVLLVAEEHPENTEPVLAGFLIGTVEKSIPIYRLREFGFIHDVWVQPAFRRHGIAKALTLAAIERFRAMGVEQVRLETARANGSARRVFESCGFRVATEEMLLAVGGSEGR